MRHVTRRNSTFALSIAASCLGLVQIGGRAEAQEAPGAAPASDDDVLLEVVVTATRQEQVLSRVPISVSAFDKRSIEQKGIKSFEELARFTPGVDFSNGDAPGNANTITIRGISSGAGSGTTGIYLDDTPIQMRALGFAADESLPGIFDLQRVEVLRGPQGTLFGAGSEGGTVRYITVQPSLVNFSGTTRTEVASTRYGDLSYEGGAALGGPILEDRLGFRVSAWYRHDGGYVDRVDTNTGRITDKDANHGRATALRGALTFQPFTGLTITPSVLYQRRTTNDVNSYFVGISDPSAGRFLNGSPEVRGSRDRFTLPSLYVRYDAGPVSVVSNTSYFKRDNLAGYDGTLYNLGYYQDDFLQSDECLSGDISCRTDLYPLLTPTGVNPELPPYLSPSVVTNNQRNFTQELRVQSNDAAAKLTWVAGVFFQKSRQESIEELVDPQANDLFAFLFDGMTLEDWTGAPNYQFGNNIDSYINDTNATDKQTAVFADVTYSLTEQFKVTVGGRYARTTYQFTNFADGAQNYGRTDAAGKSSERPFTPKAGVSYQVNENNMVYLTYSEGFRQGGANAPVPFDACEEDLTALGLSSSPNTYESDSVQSWEIGTKNNLLDRRLQLAISAYDIKWTDIQDSVFLASCAIQFTGNLGEAASRGFDVQLAFRPLRGFTVDATLGYTDAYYTEATRAGSRTIVSKGDGLGVPPWTFSLGLEKTFPVAAFEGYVRGDYEYRARLDRLTAQRNPNDSSYDSALLTAPKTHLVSLRGGAMIGKANLSLFVDNVLDSRPRLTYGHQSRSTVLFQSSTWRPRTVGLTLNYDW